LFTNMGAVWFVWWVMAGSVLLVACSGSSLRTEVSSALSAGASFGSSGQVRDAENSFTLVVNDGTMSGPTGPDACWVEGNKLHFNSSAPTSGDSKGIHRCFGIELSRANTLLCTCSFGVEDLKWNYWFRWDCTSSGQPNPNCFKWGAQTGTNDLAFYQPPCCGVSSQTATIPIVLE
jgi:hypothetical protein